MKIYSIWRGGGGKGRGIILLFFFSFFPLVHLAMAAAGGGELQHPSPGAQELGEEMDTSTGARRMGPPCSHGGQTARAGLLFCRP